VPLTPKAFETLVALVERSGRLVEKDELTKVVWADAFVEGSNLTNNVYALRKMLGQGEDGRSYIETVPKRGYRFTAPVRELPPETLVGEKRTLTRVVTEEAVPDDSRAPSMIGAGEALGVGHASARAHRRSKRPWLLVALSTVALGIGGFFIYRSLTAGPRSQIDSIAVLPFKNESGNADIEYLSDGVTETLINSLSQLSNFVGQSTQYRFPLQRQDGRAPNRRCGAIGASDLDRAGSPA
jgi:DNA-binding winged helix-turn-helix (wHTH) protein